MEVGSSQSQAGFSAFLLVQLLFPLLTRSGRSLRWCHGTLTLSSHTHTVAHTTGVQKQVQSRVPVLPSCPPALQKAPYPLVVFLGTGHSRPFSPLLTCSEGKLDGLEAPWARSSVNPAPCRTWAWMGWEGRDSLPSHIQAENLGGLKPA